MASQSNFPSGSKWGLKEVDMVGFVSQRIEQELVTFECDVTLSSANLRILARLADVFAIPVSRLQDNDVTALYPEHSVFFEQLAGVLKPKALPDTPSKPRSRSKIRFNTSSPLTDEGQPKTPTSVPSDFGSPETSPAAGASKRKILTQAATPPATKLSPAMSTSQERVDPASGLEHMADESVPELPEGEHRVSSQSDPTCDDDEASSESDQEISTSSGDASSSYIQSSPILPTAIVPDPDADVLEDELVCLFYLFFTSIIAEHKKNDGISFTTHYAEGLSVAIDGLSVRTRPDLTVSVIFSDSGIEIPILDYEGKRLSEKPNFAQRVSEMLGRSCYQKANHDHKSSYKPYVFSAHHTKMTISTCKFRDSYLDKLNGQSERLRSKELIQVTEYGPVDIREPANRVLAGQNVYKLMLQLAERARKDWERELKREREQEAERANK